MVFQEESFASRWWPFNGKTSPRSGTKSPSTQEPRDALDLFELMEKGKVREFVEDFMRPMPDSGKLHRFYVKRSEDRKRFSLYKDLDGSFVMHAEVKHAARQVHFFLYDPEDRENVYDPQRPDFTMSFNQAKSEWMLERVQDGKWYSPRQSTHSCASSREKDEIAFVEHSKVQVGDGVNHCLEANIARISDDTQQSKIIDRLVTRQATWNDELNCLVLDFKDRKVIPSAKNFQLAREGRLQRVVCQYGKIDNDTFSLDFRYPLSITQAFAMAVSTASWE